jgi:hypothetical protein
MAVKREEAQTPVISLPLVTTMPTSHGAFSYFRRATNRGSSQPFSQPFRAPAPREDFARECAGRCMRIPNRPDGGALKLRLYAWPG